MFQTQCYDLITFQRYTVVATNEEQMAIPKVAGDLLQTFYNFIQGTSVGDQDQRQLKPETVTCVLFYVRDKDPEAPASCLMWTDQHTLVPSVRITHNDSQRLQRYLGNRKQLSDDLTPDIYFSHDRRSKDQNGRK